MGLFGSQDAHDVSDNPFYVEDGTFQSVLTEFLLKETKDGEKRGLSFNWTVDEEGEWEGSPISEWIGVWLTDDEAEASTVRRDRARSKKRLGEIGLSADEMNELVDDDGIFNEQLAEKFVGTVAFVTVKNSKDKNFDENGKVYTNITKVDLPA